jgi:anti-sigma factor RsiW
MNCSQMHKLLEAHHDGELDAANTLQVDEHLADCPHCFGALRRLAALRVALQNEALRFAAPAVLRDNVRALVAQNAAAERPAPSSRAWLSSLGWVAAVAVIVAWTLTATFESRQGDDRLLAELTSSHVRSLMAAHLTDVTSTDQHTVKPWFDGKLEFAPPVRDLREAGFPLLGGRLDFIDGHSAAALVYGRQKHLLNLFVWPASTATPRKLETTQRHGYNVARWSDGKMDFSAISDLNENELRVFVSDWSGK